MRSPKRRQSLTGYRAQKRPKVLVAMNQNEPELFATETSIDRWEAVGDVAGRLQKRWWLDE